MAVVSPVIFQITGYQNSGKTTFINKLLAQLNKEGLRVATVKHHGHGGKPAVSEEKDSSRHIASGAVASLVEGGGRLLIQAEKEEWPLEEKLVLLAPFQSDIVLIEGHKNAQYPKAVLVRNRDELRNLLTLANIQAVYFWDMAVQKEMEDKNIPAFHINDPHGLEWLVGHLAKMVMKGNNR